MDVPLEILDREVARAATSLRAADAALRRGEVTSFANPLALSRRVSSRATYEELTKNEPAAGDALSSPAVKPPDAALRDGLRAWLYALTLERVLWDDRVHFEAALREESIPIEHADLGRFQSSPHALLLRVLSEPAAPRRGLLADALANGATSASVAARIEAERRAEAARRLPADPDTFEIPCSPRGSLQGVAEALLRRTEALLERGSAAYHDILGESVGRTEGAGWPSRLLPRWIEELFRPTGLTEGLRIELGPLPQALGASSFARALAAFGAGLADADGPRGVPFSLAHPPFDLRRARRAALFGGLPADPVFGARALGLGRGQAHDQARAIAHALLRSLRLGAARVLLRGALELPDHARAGRFEELTAEAIGAPIPAALAGVLPRLRPGDATALMGALLAARDRRELIERFDEDWFRNPHAAIAIREEDGVLPASPRTTSAELEAGIDELIRFLEAC